MKKIEISQHIKLLIYISLLLVLLMYAFYLLTNFGGFLYFCIGYVIGTVFNAVKQYLDKYSRERRFAEAEAKLGLEIPEPEDFNSAE